MTQIPEASSAEPATIGYFAAPTGEIFASEAALRAMRKTRPWALGCAVGMLVYALVGGVLGTMWLVVVIIKAGQPGFQPAQFIFVIPPNLIGSPLALTGGILAVRYHAAVGRAIARRNPEDLELALKIQLYIWRWAAVTVLALFAMLPIIVLTGFITGVWR